MKGLFDIDLSMKTATVMDMNVYGYIALVLLVILAVWYIRKLKKEKARDAQTRQAAGHVPTTKETIESVCSDPDKEGSDKYGTFSRLGGM